MRQPLVSRPAYGAPVTQVGVSQLPQGPPAGKGLPLDKNIPNAKTFAKPEDDIRQPNVEDSSMYRQDDANSLLKDQTVPDERDHSQFKPRYEPGGKDDTPKTKYPYRDGIPNTHNAARIVLGLWLVQRVPDALVALSRGVTGATLAEVENNLSPEIRRRSKKCRVDLKRADNKNLRWLFSVNSGNGPYIVRLKAVRPKKGIVDFSKMDVKLSCSCPAWQWLGPEFHAKGESYQDGAPRGTASIPNIKDPMRTNKVCKHVAAVIALVRKWRLSSKQASVGDVWTVLVPTDEMRIECQHTACRVPNAAMWKTGD